MVGVSTSNIDALKRLSDVEFDFGVSAAVEAAFRAAAAKVSGQRGSRAGWRSTGLTDFEGHFSEVFRVNGRSGWRTWTRSPTSCARWRRRSSSSSRRRARRTSDVRSPGSGPVVNENAMPWEDLLGSMRALVMSLSDLVTVTWTRPGT